MKKTKIICTLGPSTDSREIIKQLMLNGMDVARLNMSHQNQKFQKIRADMVKEVRKELNLPVALLLDTKGPEIRIKSFSTPKVTLKKNDTFTLTSRDVIGDSSIVSVTFPGLINDISIGNIILIDDGLVGMKVKSITDTDIVCTVLNSGTLSAHKSINVPSIKLSMPFISDADYQDIKFAVDENFDFIAASFTRTADDIITLRSELQKLNGEHINIIAKIENLEGVKNIDEIIKVADGIMVARGDLGVEIPIEDVPVMQKKLIHKAYAAGKHVITATQMLESMVKNPRPTRAESNDVANAIYDGTSAIMLSGETAAGNYPVLALKTMAAIAKRTEQDIDYKKRFLKREITEKPNITSAVSHATCTTAHDLGAVAIIAMSKSGRTIRMISKYRPDCTIVGGASNETVLRQMNLSWGVIPLYMTEKPSTDELFNHTVETAYKHGIVKDGDIAVITVGIPLGTSGNTNLIKVHLVGDVLISGHGVTNLSASGSLCVCKNEDEAKKKFKHGNILVIPKTSNEILDIVKSASAIVTEDVDEDSHAAVLGFAINKPVIINAKNATKLLESGTLATVDSGRGIVFRGTKL